ncbi:hypothetical protein [Halochromatium glycolicum]|uniref:hypothetical protein n=1 Tax=Halochromatium glycolicum TaxID=85075 RepID=UPI00190DC446|nr:hypothetical protein [Halochromatium glycolicum]
MKIRERVSGRQVILASAHVVQINIVGHTGANGFARLTTPAVFDGDVISGPLAG